MKKYYFSAYILVITAFFVSGSAYAVNSSRTLTTSHFIIKYNISESNPAILLSLDIESIYDTISSFLNFDPLEKIHVNVTEDLSSMIPTAELYQDNNFLSVYAGGDYNRIKSELHDKLFTVFLRKLIQTQNITSVIDENLFWALTRYPVTSREFQNIKLNDLVNIEGLNLIKLNKISKFNKNQQQIIYSAFIDFIISSYGKKILIQSLKDTVYYNGFLKSISMITGYSAADIENGFNSWLLQYKSDDRLQTDGKMELIHFNDEYNDSSYSISDDGQSAILQMKDDKYRILLKSAKPEEIIYLKNSEAGSSFNELFFIGNSRIAVIEILQTGSKIFLYDIPGKNFFKTIPLFHLFISEIKYSGEGTFIFSAMCGSHSDIYTIEIKTGQFNILTESGNNYSPIILDNKVYFVSMNDKSDIRELDNNTGGVKSIFSAEGKLTDLNRVDNHTFTFSMNINGKDTLYVMNTKSGSFIRVNIASPSILKPRITGRYIYFFSFFKSRYRLFRYEYNI